MRHSRPHLVRLIGIVCAFSAAVVAVGCAPEPGTIAGQADKGSSQPNGESSWGTPTEDFDAEAKTTELPASFPTDLFPLPASAVIDNVGERGEGTWFVVLRASDQAAADALWQEIVTLGGFTAGVTSETTEGGIAAELTSAALVVTAVTIPQGDGTVLVSYDLSRTAA